MKFKTKIMLVFLSILVVLLILPAFIINFATADVGMALCLILFFIVDPLALIVIGCVSGRDARRMWWAPLVSCILFPLLFSMVVADFVGELFIYSAFYFLMGAVAMLISYAISKRKTSKS